MKLSHCQEKKLKTSSAIFKLEKRKHLFYSLAMGDLTQEVLALGPFFKNSLWILSRNSLMQNI